MRNKTTVTNERYFSVNRKTNTQSMKSSTKVRRMYFGERYSFGNSICYRLFLLTNTPKIDRITSCDTLSNWDSYFYSINYDNVLETIKVYWKLLYKKLPRTFLIKWINFADGNDQYVSKWKLVILKSLIAMTINQWCFRLRTITKTGFNSFHKQKIDIKLFALVHFVMLV